jgi:bifunctional UDP-N-acetylglucosamine pyrophosphorylase/glucosamine-1-phosphate N-acetyltransferase
MQAHESQPESPRPLACVVLAAGKGTRMKSARPKVLHPLAGEPMLRHVLRAATAAGAVRTIVVIGPDMDDVAAEASPHETVVQTGQAGTGDAVRTALPLLQGWDGDVLVLFGDAPLVTADHLRALIDRRGAADDPAVVVMGVDLADPAAFGRLVVDADGGLRAIVEYRDADAETRAIRLCNGGLTLFDGARLAELVGALSNDNAKGEFYLTDCVALARERGWTAAHVVVDGDQGLLGINSRAELAAAERLFQDRLRSRAMAQGTTLVAPETVFLTADTVLGRDVLIEPNVVFGPGVTVGDEVTIRAFSHIEGARIEGGAIVGPYARLRPGAEIGKGAHIGNFVEVKNATLGAGAKANHLTYLGDADIGAGSNVGAGTITCNYDGFFKHRTVVGEGVFVGSNTALVAPVTVGDGVNIAAGSVITADVEADALAVGRARQETKPGWAKRYRDRLAKAKAQKKAGKTP